MAAPGVTPEPWGACVVCGGELRSAYSRQRGYGFQCRERTEGGELAARLQAACWGREAERDAEPPVRFWPLRLFLQTHGMGKVLQIGHNAR